MSMLWGYFIGTFVGSLMGSYLALTLYNINDDRRR